jgi:hypothetical protein
MKPTIALLFSSLAVAFAAQPKAELAQVHKVYLLPMSNGMDQYLANRIAGLGVFQVVTDPKRADAIFTDRLGEAFESQQAEWFPAPTPRPTPPPAAPTPAPAPGAPPSAVNFTPHVSYGEPYPMPSPQPQQDVSADSENKDDSGPPKTENAAPPLSASHRSKGTLFLVDPRSRVVLWSIYAPPKDTSAAQLDRTAARIANRIQQELKGK